jgi:hypothetical protein
MVNYNLTICLLAGTGIALSKHAVIFNTIKIKLTLLIRAILREIGTLMRFFVSET